jgi:5-methyltetrahydropteroyltriglutamate--homocysteine methyltransferase
MLRALGESFNLMTLGGLAAAVGLVIDDAIVVVENIVMHRDAGQDRAEAIRSAIAEIRVPLVGSTITPIVVFLPLISITGVTGTFFRALAVTVGVALLTSLALALTWTPTLSHFFIRRSAAKPESRIPAPDARRTHGVPPRLMAAYERMTGSNVARRAVCVGPIAVQDRQPLAEDLANLKAALAQVGAVEGFMTAASPGLVPVFQTNSYYPSHEAYVEAIAAAMQEEYEAIVGAGFVLQLDCPDLAMAHHTSFQDLSEADFLKRAAFHVETLNHALRNVPAEMCRIHICWGNYEGPHDHDIDFAKVAPILVKAKPQALVIEAANPRHAHEWTVWKDIKLPDDKILVAGVLDTSTNYVEHPELVAERLCRFADIVGRERVMAGSDCGFGTFAGYGKLDPDISFKKLHAMAEGAAIASKRLWGGA